MSETFNTNVEINGSSDTTQLKVNAHSSQTAPLQSWNTSSGDQVARTETDGRFQTGSLNTGAGATGDAQIEVFRHEDAIALPARGLNITGAIKDALTGIVSWSVHELFLKGSAGVQALHSALRVRLVNQNTGTTNTGAELRAGEFEVSNAGGVSGNPIPVATGLDVRVTNDVSGHIGTAYGMRVEVDDLNTNGIADAYAIHATGAKTRLDDVLELHGDRASAPAAESQLAKIYVKSDGKLYARIGSGAEYVLSIAPVPVDSAKFLRGDGTWAVPSAAGANQALSNLASVAINASLISNTDNTVDLGTTAKKWRQMFSNALTLEERSAPSTPATGDGVLYAKTDGMYFKGDDGIEIGPLVGKASGMDPRSTAGPITTTDNTWTTFISTPVVGSNSAICVDGIIFARRDTGGSTIVARFVVAFERAGGNVSVGGMFLNVNTTAGSPPEVTANVNTMTQVGMIQIRGVTGTNWVWHGRYQITGP